MTFPLIFRPPLVASGGDPCYGDVVLLLGFEGADGATSTTDESPTTPHTVSFSGNAQIDTAQKKYGDSSLELDGSGDFLSISHNADFNFADQPFTIECWVRFRSVAAAAFISKWPSTAGINEWNFGYTGTNLEFICAVSSTNTVVAGAWSPGTTNWHHVAVDRDASHVFRVYANGVMIQKVSANRNINPLATAIRIGRRTAGDWQFNGWIDEMRVTKGCARYESDSGYTVPTSAFPRF
jgi:hypothetical protein